LFIFIKSLLFECYLKQAIERDKGSYMEQTLAMSQFYVTTLWQDSQYSGVNRPGKREKYVNIPVQVVIKLI